jgi:hypothetical protein
MNTSFDALCDPAKLYIVLSIIAIIVALIRGMPLSAVVLKAFFILFWTWVLNYLCSKGFKMVSWFLVLFPFIVMFSAFVYMVSFGSKKRIKR